MKNSSIKAYALGLLVSIISFFTIFSYSIEYSSKLSGDIEWVKNAYKELEKCKTLQYEVLAVESSLKNYHITGHKSFIRNIEADFEKIEASLSDLRKLTADNASQQENALQLGKLIQRKKQLFYSSQSKNKLQYPQTNGSFVNDKEEGEIALLIQREFRTLEKAEQKLLANRSEELRVSQRNTFIYNLLAGIFSLFLAGISSIRLLHHVREQSFAKKAIEQKEEKLSIIYNSTSDGIILLNLKDLSIIDYNESVLRLFNVASKSSLIGKDIFELEDVPPTKKEREKINTMLAQSKIWNGEVVYRTAMGNAFWGNGSIWRVTIDGQEFAIARIIDITKRKNAERSMNETSRILNRLLENIPIIINKIDSKGIVTLTKGSGLKTLGMKEGEGVGQSIYTRFPHFAEHVKKAYSGESVIFTSQENHSGRAYFLEHYLFRDKDSRGGLISFTLDITVNKLAEKELIKAKQEAEHAAKARQKFLSTMSHEIRTPLNAIIGMTHLLLQDRLTNQQTQRLNILKFSGENLLSTLNDILDFSKIESGAIGFSNSDFNLVDLVKNTHESFKNLADSKGIKLKLLMGDNLPFCVKGDSHRLNQVLNNLLNNAIKFTERGSVTLEVNKERETKKKVFLSFQVKDTGIGIPAKKLQSVFEPFKQAEAETYKKYGGTGLGLAIIKNIIELQGGRVKLESEIDVGSTFKVFISYDKSTLMEQAIKHQEDLVSLGGARVLYVEDVVFNQVLLEGFCDLWNVDLDVASAGMEALVKVQDQEYDLVLMDIQMPGIDGYETTRRIRNLGSNFQTLPIVALSAEVSEEVKVLIREAGMNGYLSKPIVPAELHSIIKKFAPELSLANLTEADLIDMDPLDLEKVINFDVLDRLFENEVEDYIKFLDNLLFEFSKYLDDISNNIRTKDRTGFINNRHKLLSLLKTLKAGYFLEILDIIKAEFESGSDLVLNEDVTLHPLCRAYDHLTQEISKKIENIREKYYKLEK